MDQPGPDQKPLLDNWDLPPDWPEVPRFVVFFITAPIPLGLPDGWTGCMTFEGERVEWLKQLGPGAMAKFDRSPIPYNPEGLPFVSLYVSRLEFPFGLGAERLILATGAYERMKGQVEFAPDAPFYAKAAQGAFLTGAASHCTVFELMTPLVPVGGEGEEIELEASVWDAFDRSFGALEAVHRAYVTTVDDWAVRPPNRRTLHPVVPWTTRVTATGEVEVLRYLRVNDAEHWPRGAKETLGDRTLGHLDNHVQVVLSSSEQGNPHLDFVEYAKRGQHAFFAQGDYTATLIWSHMSSERLLNGALLMSGFERGVGINEAAQWLEDPLRKRTQRHFGRRFGGRWNTRDGDSLIGKWSQNVVDVRNRVVHGGKGATESEAIAASNSCVDLERYLKHRLIARRHEFPNTAMVFVGVPVMKERGAWDDRMERALEQFEEELRWIDEYEDWIQSVYAQAEDR